MHTGDECHCHGSAECLECGPPAQERLNYFTGQFLAQRDFCDEQRYWMGKHRQHNRYLHGWGTVCGLRVVPHPVQECQDRFVIIEPGLALDCCGREILVREPVYVDVPKLLAKYPADANRQFPNLLLSICYDECKTEVVPALYSECGCDETRCEPSRVHESFDVKLQPVDQLPKPDCGCEPAGVRLKWSTTINLKGASRLALDSPRQRLYVLTQGNPSQVMVYDTGVFSGIRAIELPAPQPPIVGGQPVRGGREEVIERKPMGIDLAVSSDGHFLYVLYYLTEKVEYRLSVIRVKDDSGQDQQAAYVNNFPLGKGPADTKNRVVVAAKTGLVHTLNCAEKTVTIWKSAINAPGANGSLALTDPNSPKFAVFATGPDPRDIAVTADGVWLFIAEAADTGSVTVAKVATLAGAQTVRYLLPLGEIPAVLSVSGDSLRLYVATETPKLRGFRIQELAAGTPGFPEIGNGVSLGADKPAALATSPSGKWAYVLAGQVGGTVIRAVNGEKLEADPEHALGEAVPVMDGPRDLEIDKDGQRLFAASKGKDGEISGGVSVLDVNEEPCAEIFWRALDGCPECPDDLCVPLAAIIRYAPGVTMTEGLINNRIRPLAPSTETLRKVILCALECGGGGKGSQGSQGEAGLGIDDAEVVDTLAPGLDAWADLVTKPGGRRVVELKIPRGDKGADGAAGPGLEENLTRIIALSWKHNEAGSLNDCIISIKNPQGVQSKRRGIVIGFGKAMDKKALINVTAIQNSQHIFQVLAPHNDAVGPKQGFLCWCQVAGTIVPVKWEPAAGPLITSATEVAGPTADGVAFVFDSKLEIGKQILFGEVPELFVRLRGDFVLDAPDISAPPSPPKAIDAEFVRGQLPTGDRPRDSKYGIQGGIFESWFTIKQG